MKKTILSLVSMVFICAMTLTSCAEMSSATDNPVSSDEQLFTPLTLEAITAGTIVVQNPKAGMQYSKNGGTKTAVTSEAISVAVGDKVQFYGTAKSYAGTQIVGGTADVKVYGNIMSLVDATNFATATTLTEAGAFSWLFGAGFPSTNSHLKDASALLLPATALSVNCYNQMFRGCTSLTIAPKLPATTLAANCYFGMLRGCTSLTAAPELPATTLVESCYMYMFRDCTSLTTAPKLPATTLVYNCYSFMFRGCTSLNSVTCLATDISDTDCTYGWLMDVAATGTFTKAASMTGWSSGSDGIPSGWQVANK